MILEFLLATALVLQQPPIGTSTKSLQWDQSAASLTEAQTATYKYYADGATTGVLFQNVACTGAVSPFVCTVPFPAFTPGSHVVQLTAANQAGETAKSSSFTFTFVVILGIPTNIRIIGGGDNQ